jgi:Outer membrane protein beta-barrel domain
MASAEEGERNMYVIAKGGPYFPTATNAFTALGNLSFTWPTAYTIEGGVGAYWGLFGLQLSAGYITTGTTTTTVGSSTTQTSMNAIPILLLARLRLPLGFVAPYLEGGAGVAIATSSFHDLNLSNTQAGFEAVGGAGCDLYFGPLIVGAELRYIWLNPSFNFSGVTGVTSFTQSLNMSGITIEAYIGYRF